ncbi:MAG TPA: HEAT repeat domain-containing protein [Solimonas sp.]|nr:HEAT repeat domain-containing protein [Solimonas sp.]
MIDIQAADPFVAFAYLASGGIFLLCGGLLLVIGALHWRRRWRDHRTELIEARWRPLLLQSLDGALPEFPPLPARHRLTVLWLWSRMAEWLEDSARTGLVRAARRLRLDRAARELLTDGDLRERLLAAVILGNMRDLGSWDELVAAVDEWHATLSMAAARALLRTDPRRALPVVLDAGLRRGEWPIGMLLAMLREVGPRLVTPPLCERLRTVEGTRLRRLLSLLPIAEQAKVRPVLLARLDASEDPEFIAGALRHLGEPEDAERLRRYCEHPSWVVRVRAIHALARLARDQDLPLFARRLDDAQWWVRLRAAESLLDHPRLTPPALEALLEGVAVGAEGRHTLLQLQASRLGA